jgi:hypothetical protein
LEKNIIFVEMYDTTTKLYVPFPSIKSKKKKKSKKPKRKSTKVAETTLKATPFPVTSQAPAPLTTLTAIATTAVVTVGTPAVTTLITTTLSTTTCLPTCPFCPTPYVSVFFSIFFNLLSGHLNTLF